MKKYVKPKDDLVNEKSFLLNYCCRIYGLKKYKKALADEKL
ncbi:MAG: hypothetical protein ACRCW5_00300 [Cetobacterium sp.]|nr:hypothetical protein [uncultured Cetobacterium sp.]